jgi:1-acyl-sn-glycerol-3-phosphate acyltransferase
MKLLARTECKGSENDIDEGRVIYAINHISGMDPPFVAAHVRRQLTFMAKKELLQIPIAGWLLKVFHALPVDRGGYSRTILDLMRKRLELEDAVLIFPEGTRQRDGKLGEGKIGVGMLSVWTRSPVIPVYVSGTNRVKDALMFRSRFRIAIGVPVYPPEANRPDERRSAYQSVTDSVMAEIARLKAVTDDPLSIGEAG